MTIISTIVLTILSAYLYRMGGSENKPKWLWKARDLGCGLCVLAWLSINVVYSWLMILCLGLMWASLSSYWGKLTPNDDEEYWWNFALHGFFIGFSLIPLVGELSFLPILYRSLALAVTFALWTQFIRNAVVSEAGRGALIILTLLILGV